MKNIIVVFTLFYVTLVYSQNIRFNKTEYFTVSASVDPTSSFKENGLDIVAEIEYVGLIYTKVGLESFSVLYKGYFDVHGAIGVNLTSGLFENVRYYIGGRMSCVFRDHAFAVNPGIEGGIDFKITDKLFLGLRGTIDKRFDQGIFHWPIETKPSGFVRIGYWWK